MAVVQAEQSAQQRAAQEQAVVRKRIELTERTERNKQENSKLEPVSQRLPAASHILDKLNEPQQRAVQALGGPVLVLAGPGSGKTRVLTHRIAYLIANVGIDPHNILAVTFTNKAAKEMRERLTGLIGEEYTKRLTVGTFHSVCVRLLRSEIEKLGWSKAIVQFAADDAATYDALARLGGLNSVLIDYIEDDQKRDLRRAAVVYRDSETVEAALAGIARQPNVSVEQDLKQWLPASLRDEAIRRGIVVYRKDFTVYDDDDQTRLMRQVIKELNLDEKQYPPRAIHSAISRAKNELVGPTEWAALGRSYWDEIVARCYDAYQKKLQANNALDFDDLLVQTVRLFEQKPKVLEHYQKRYIHVLIDEYQDVNTTQYVFAKQISGGYRNLFAVGDEDQSVYAFRGANMRYVLQFEEDFPDSKLILLEQNYRSTQAILDVASALINASTSRKHAKRLWTQNDKGVEVLLREAYNEDEEARLVCDEIERLRGRGDAEFKDCAVLYRTNAQSRALEEAFLTRGIRYRLVGGVRFYERKEIKDVLAWLRVVANPFDSVSLERIIEATPGIGRTTIAALTEWATNDLGVPVYSALQILADDGSDAKAPLAARARSGLIGFLHLLDELIKAKDERGLIELLDVVLERTRFHEALAREHGDDEGENRWENVLELRTVATQYTNFPREEQLPMFLEEVALVAATDDLATEQDAVTLITMHQAKGLEYPNVFIVGLEEGLLPHSRSLEDTEQLEEERRLFYVAATRAERRLYLYYAFKRRLYGRENIATPSRFLQDIPSDMVRRKEQRDRETSSFGQSTMFTGRSAFGSRPATNGAKTRSATSWGSTGKKNTTPFKPPANTKFTAGQKVRHAQFGEGIVVSSKVQGDDEEVTIAFVGHGVKRLLAAFAKLEVVK
jgi:DNA helicase II / ATP-dependent DNA helicase PcrA